MENNYRVEIEQWALLQILGIKRNKITGALIIKFACNTIQAKIKYSAVQQKQNKNLFNIPNNKQTKFIQQSLKRQEL